MSSMQPNDIYFWRLSNEAPVREMKLISFSFLDVYAQFLKSKANEVKTAKIFRGIIISFVVTAF